ncbi:MAG: acylphosphatase [SAR324 cluster bacterium]|jgi:acylphosphatase|nr:acylphosphatase [SAR324 cluster bacterium]MCH2265688.1 acylphosphatase [SAR324 cluster bacterium]
MATEMRLDLVISGNVQGVGYRFSVKIKAESLGIRGYVRNQRDGSVFVAAQGATAVVEKFVKWCYLGPPAAIVSGIERIPGATEDFREFSVLY